jgi:hypothetical protein
VVYRTTILLPDGHVQRYIAMLSKILFVVASVAIGSAALAEDAKTPAGLPVTASAAKKAHEVLFAGGGSKDIFDVKAGPNDTLSAIEVVEDNRGIDIPGSTISAGDKPSRVRTSLTLKDLTSH